MNIILPLLVFSVGIFLLLYAMIGRRTVEPGFPRRGRPSQVGPRPWIALMGVTLALGGLLLLLSLPAEVP